MDDQLAQAQADLAQAEANLQLNQANYDLARITLARDVQDKATLGTTAASVKAAEASVGVNKASVQRYTDPARRRKRPVHPRSGVRRRKGCGK